jgi:outer membrane protein assembly factor BamE (lipoprotein component of BamABCDE complex)
MQPSPLHSHSSFFSRILLCTLAYLLTFNAFSGCVMSRKYENLPLPSSFSSLQKGSTQQQVLKDFGPPTQLLRKPTGVLFLYLRTGKHNNRFFIGAGPERFNLLTLFWETTKKDQLMVFFDSSNQVMDYAFHSGTDELQTFF